MKELADDEVDAVMANIYPAHRRWCPVSCDPIPGQVMWSCACTGCIYGALSWEDFSAWEEREKLREPTPYVDSLERTPLTLTQRLEAFKLKNRRD